jgi:glycosyltransferase involved in cell wall biosynthesis
MRITFVLPYAGLQGGIRVIAAYAERLARRGHEVQLISTPQVFTMRHTARSLLTGRGFPKPEPSHLDDVNVPHRILDSVRQVTNDDVPDADVVIATYYTTAAGVLSLSDAKGAKAIFIQNYEVPPGRSNPALDATWRMPMHKIVISKWLAEWARDRFGDEDVSQVPNSVDTTQFHAPCRDRGGRATVGMLYSTSALKGCSVSLKALERVAAVVPSLRLVSYGAERPDFRLPLPGYAEFCFRPSQHRLRDFYAQCDVWMCGSHIEGFHLPPLEAMACRCPVVSSRCGGPLDIIEEGVNVHLVNVRDELAMADRVLRVLNLSDSGWKAMSDAAYRTAVRFTWEDATDLFEAALQRAIERKAQGRLAPGFPVHAAAAVA